MSSFSRTTLRGDPRRSRRQASSHGFDHLPARRKHAQHAPGTTVNHGLSVNEDLEFAVSTVNHLDIDLQLVPQRRRHTGGIQPGDSVSAITNSDMAHDGPLIRHLGRGSTSPWRLTHPRPLCHSFAGAGLLAANGPRASVVSHCDCQGQTMFNRRLLGVRASRLARTSRTRPGLTAGLRGFEVG